MSLLNVSNLSVAFPILSGVFRRKVGEFVALSDVSFNIEKGKSLGVIGESGSGKSTLARVIAGFQNPTRGELVIEGGTG